MNACSYRRPNGFTMIELMITMVVIAILAAIALPSYQNYVLRARRAECEGALMRYAGVAERRNSATMSYIFSGNQNDDKLADLFCPAESESGEVGTSVRFYNVTYNALSKTEFLLTATPVGSQTKDRCGTLTLNHLGVKTSSGAPVGACW